MSDINKTTRRTLLGTVAAVAGFFGLKMPLVEDPPLPATPKLVEPECRDGILLGHYFVQASGRLHSYVAVRSLVDDVWREESHCVPVGETLRVKLRDGDHRMLRAVCAEQGGVTYHDIVGLYGSYVRCENCYIEFTCFEPKEGGMLF